MFLRILEHLSTSENSDDDKPSILTKIKDAIDCVKNVLWIDCSLPLESIALLDDVELNETLLTCLKEIKPTTQCEKHRRHRRSNVQQSNGKGFFIPIAGNVIQRREKQKHQVSIYLCSVESHLHEFLERMLVQCENLNNICSQSISLPGLVLFVEICNLPECTYYSSSLPLDYQYNMVPDNNFYHTCYKHDNLIFNKVLTMYDEAACSMRKINQLLITSLPTLYKSGTMEEHENIFDRYFSNAKFSERCRQEKKLKQKFHTVYRIYTYDCAATSPSSEYFNDECSAQLANYIMMRFKADQFLAYNSVECYSELTNFSVNEQTVTHCFENENFQLVVVHGNSPEINNQFVLHVPSNVFRHFLANNYPSREDFEFGIGKDEDFENYDELNQFLISIRSVDEVNRMTGRTKQGDVSKTQSPLTLLQICVLKQLILLYKNVANFNYRDFVFAFSKSHSKNMYEALALYVFEHLFDLATQNFYGSLDEMYCILFTIIALSSYDEASHIDTFSSLNGSANAFVFYFYSLYLINKQPTEAHDSDRKIMYRDNGLRDLSGQELTSTNKNRWFGLYSGAYGPDTDNFLSCRFNYLKEEFSVRKSYFKSSAIIVSCEI